ncbi:MAG: hypothetical protein P8178_07560 [Candidatus Thiodiazotropha sp.]
MPLFRLLSLLLVLVPLAAVADGGSWQGYLQDGSQVRIDPATNKAIRTMDGESTPLWDGVHQLNNGAVIIVRDGVVVRDENIIEAQQAQARDRLNAACMQLVKKVCGPHNECQSHPACDPARQMLALERDELNGSWSGSVLESSTHCLEALGNETYFQACAYRKPSSSPTPCERLVVHVCGEDNRCAGAQGCNAAHQLVGMEQQDIYNAPEGKVSSTSEQCSDLLSKETPFFQSCQ